MHYSIFCILVKSVITAHRLCPCFGCPVFNVDKKAVNKWRWSDVSLKFRKYVQNKQKFNNTKYMNTWKFPETSNDSLGILQILVNLHGKWSVIDTNKRPLELVWFDAAYKEWLASTKSLHQQLQRFLELWAKRHWALLCISHLCSQNTHTYIHIWPASSANKKARD